MEMDAQENEVELRSLIIMYISRKTLILQLGIQNVSKFCNFKINKHGIVPIFISGCPNIAFSPA